MKTQDVGYTETLDTLVVSICADYERRRQALNLLKCTPRTAMEYRYINMKIDEAAEEIAGERLAPMYINEIGRKIGYAKSKVDCVSETTYKIEKQEIKINIAKKLHLLD